MAERTTTRRFMHNPETRQVHHEEVLWERVDGTGNERFGRTLLGREGLWMWAEAAHYRKMPDPEVVALVDEDGIPMLDEFGERRFKAEWPADSPINDLLKLPLLPGWEFVGNFEEWEKLRELYSAAAELEPEEPEEGDDDNEGQRQQREQRSGQRPLK